MIWGHRVWQDAMVAEGRRDEVRRRALQRAREHPQEAGWAYLAGRALLPDHERSERWFRRAVERDPSIAWGWIGRSHLQLERGDVFRSVTLLREGLDAAPRDPDLTMTLGFLYLDLQLLVDALRQLREARVLRPWDPRVLGALGQTLGQLDRGRESLRYLERALALDPSRTDWLGSVAYVHYRAGHRQQAWEALVRQQAIDGSADPLLVWRLEVELNTRMPHTAQLGPHYLETR